MFCIRLWFWFSVDWSFPFNHSCVVTPYCLMARAMLTFPWTSMQLMTKFEPACFMRWTSVATVEPG